MYSKITTHVADMKANLLFQFWGETRILALLDIIGGQIQELENVLYDLMVLRFLGVAVGAQLDQYGTVLNLPRDSDWSDDRYRALLGVRIAVIRSRGNPNTILNILAILSESQPHLEEFFPASFVLQYPGALLVSDPDWAHDIPNWITRASPPGVGSTVVEYSPTYPFGFDGDPEAYGFDNGTNQPTAGQMAAIL